LKHRGLCHPGEKMRSFEELHHACHLVLDYSLVF